MIPSKITLAALLATLSLASGAVTFTPGTYTERVSGHNAAFDVKVTLSKDKITNVEYPGNLETIGVGRVALDLLAKKIINKQSIGVDNITGATISSMALKSAVEKAMKQAKVSDQDFAQLKQNSEQYHCCPK